MDEVEVVRLEREGPRDGVIKITRENSIKRLQTPVKVEVMDNPVAANILGTIGAVS